MNLASSKIARLGTNTTPPTSMLPMVNKSAIVFLFLIQGIWCAPLEETSESRDTGEISITTEGSESAVESAVADAASTVLGGVAGRSVSVGSGGRAGIGGGRAGGISGGMSGGMGGGMSGGMGGGMGGGTGVGMGGGGIGRGGLAGGMGGGAGRSGSSRQSSSTRGGSRRSISSSVGSSGRSGTSGGSRSGVDIVIPWSGSSGSSNRGIMGLMNSMGNMALGSIQTGHELSRAGLDMAANTMYGIIGAGGEVGSNAAQTLSSGSNLGSFIGLQGINTQMAFPTRTSSSYSLGQSSGQNIVPNGISSQSTQGQRSSEGSNYEFSSAGNAANLGRIPAISVNMQGQVPTSTYNNYQETNSGSYGGDSTGTENAANLAIPAFSVNMQRQMPSSTYNDQDTDSGSYGAGNTAELVMNGVQSAANMIRPQVSISSNTPISSSRSGLSFTVPSSSGSSNDLSSLLSKLSMSYDENTGNGKTVTLMYGGNALGTMNANDWSKALTANNNNVGLAIINSMRRGIVRFLELPISLMNRFRGDVSRANLQIPFFGLSF